MISNTLIIATIIILTTPLIIIILSIYWNQYFHFTPFYFILFYFILFYLFFVCNIVGSDPYVAVRTDPPQLISEIVKSKVLLHNLNPDWESEVLQLKLNTNDTNGLKENGHICITVWDWDR